MTNPTLPALAEGVMLDALVSFVAVIRARGFTGREALRAWARETLRMGALTLDVLDPDDPELRPTDMPPRAEQLLHAANGTPVDAAIEDDIALRSAEIITALDAVSHAPDCDIQDQT